MVEFLSKALEGDIAIKDLTLHVLGNLTVFDLNICKMLLEQTGLVSKLEAMLTLEKLPKEVINNLTWILCNLARIDNANKKTLLVRRDRISVI